VVDFDPSSLDIEPVPADLVWCSGRDVPWEPVLVMQPRPPSDSFLGGRVHALEVLAGRILTIEAMTQSRTLPLPLPVSPSLPPSLPLSFSQFRFLHPHAPSNPH